MLLAAVAVVASACTTTNPAYCDQNTPCESGRCDMDAHECIGTTDDAGPDIDAALCERDEDCTSPDTPFCNTQQGVCRGCVMPGNPTAECMTVDNGRPFCSDDGRCAACLANDDCTEQSAAVCDPTELTCRACDPFADAPECTGSPFGEQCSPEGACVECVGHGDCASDVCDRDTYECVEESAIIHVGGSGAADTSTCGSMAQPCETIQFGVSRVTATTRHLRIAPGIYPSADTVFISGMDVTLVGPGAHLLVGPEDAPVMRVNGGSTVALDGVTIRGASANAPDGAAHGVLCENTGTTLTVRRAEIRSNDRHGIDANGCEVTVEETIVGDNGERGVDVASGTLRVVRSRIENNRRGGVLLNPGAFHIENSLIVDNGDASSTVGGIAIGNFDAASPQALLYNTIAGNQADPSAAASGVDCSMIASTPTLVGNIVYFGSGPSASVAGEGCDWEYSDIENGPAGDGNVDVDPGFANAGDGDYHLQSDSPLRDIGTTVPEITVDVDGQPRDDGAYDIGADEVVSR